MTSPPRPPRLGWLWTALAAAATALIVWQLATTGLADPGATRTMHGLAAQSVGDRVVADAIRTVPAFARPLVGGGPLDTPHRAARAWRTVIDAQLESQHPPEARLARDVVLAGWGEALAIDRVDEAGYAALERLPCVLQRDVERWLPPGEGLLARTRCGQLDRTRAYVKARFTLNALRLGVAFAGICVLALWYGRGRGPIALQQHPDLGIAGLSRAWVVLSLSVALPIVLAVPMGWLFSDLGIHIPPIAITGLLGVALLWGLDAKVLLAPIGSHSWQAHGLRTGTWGQALSAALAVIALHQVIRLALDALTRVVGSPGPGLIAHSELLWLGEASLGLVLVLLLVAHTLGLELAARGIAWPALRHAFGPAVALVVLVAVLQPPLPTTTAVAWLDGVAQIALLAALYDRTRSLVPSVIVSGWWMALYLGDALALRLLL